MKTYHEAASSHPDRRGKCRDFLKLAAALIATVHLTGCATTGTLTAPEKAAVVHGEKSIVLLRVACGIGFRKAYEPFGHILLDDNVSFGIGTFETGGVPLRSVSQRFPSPESRKQGWTCFVLPRGTCYLSVYPPRRTNILTYESAQKNAPRWRIDVPANAGIVYAGTMHLTGGSDWLIGGGRIMSSIHHQKTTVVNEQKLAAKVASECFPEFGRIHVSPMRRHEGGPVILRAPLPAGAR